MAETEKKGPGRPPKVKQTAMNPEELQQVLPDELSVPGIVFKWVNYNHRNKHGWGIWRVVDADSELGAEVSKQLGHMRTNAMASSGMFYKEDLTLAFASEEAHEQMREKRKAANTERMKAIDAAELRRNVIIPAAPGFGKK